MRKMIRAAVVCMTAWLAAGTCAWAQDWTGTKLNGLAVTDGSGKIVVLGTEGSYNNTDNRTKEAVFDGDTATFFDPPASIATTGACWAGIELTIPKMVTRIRYFGRAENANRMRGVLFQGADDPDFTNAVTLHIANPPAGWLGTNSWVDVTLSGTNTLRTFTHLRVIGPNPYVGGAPQDGTYAGNAAEVEFYGADLTTTAAPPPPALIFANAANWRANLKWTITEDAMVYEIQRMLTNETEYATVLTDSFINAGTRSWIDPKYLYGDAAYRIRAINDKGASAWVDIPVQTRNAAAGAWFGTAGTYGSGMTGDKLFDGDIGTYFDSPTLDGKPDVWSALDLGEPREITSIRYMPRADWQTRMPGGRFQAANNTNFTGAVTLHTIPSTPLPLYNAFTEVPASDATPYRYVRYVSSHDNRGNAYEIEFVIPPHAPHAPVGLAAVSSDVTNDYPVLSWEFAPKNLVSSSIVHRATAPGGPYAPVTPEGVSGTVWTDTTAAVGILYYYKVSALYTDGATIYPGPLSAFAMFRRGERIERTWDDNTQLKNGMTGFLHERPYTAGLHGITNAFDGKLDTFVDVSPRNGIVGVDLGAPYHISKMRFAPRADQVARLNGAVLCGSNNLIAETNILATFTGAIANTYTWVAADSGDAYRYIFVTRTDTAEFYGNIAELELYGWSASAAAGLLTAPASVTFTFGATSLQVNWTAGDNATLYRVERAAASTPETWVTIGDTTAALSLADTAPLMHTPSLYRVIALRDAEEASSDAFPVVPYAPGGGTGLLGHYTSGFTKAYDPSEALRLTRVDPGIDFTWSNVPIISDVPESVTNVLVVWNGTLIVPFTGGYTFHATTDDGIALRIDGTFVINEWNATGTRSSAPVTLTAGSHDIRMDYYQGVGNAYARLEWDGAVTRAVIPAAQLIPADLPSEDIGPWRGRTFNAPKLGTHTVDAASGGIRIESGGLDFHSGAEGCHFVWQPISGPFLLEATVEQFSEGQSSAKALLVIRNSLEFGSPLLAAACMARSPVFGYGVKGRLAPGINIADLLSPGWQGEVTNPCRMRLKRVQDSITMEICNEGGAWETFYTYGNASNVFNSSVVVGLAVTSPNVTAGRPLPSAIFSDIRFVSLSGTVLTIQ